MVVGSCLVAGALAAQVVPDWTMPPSQDFPLAGGDYSNRRYSALNQINTSNIEQLGGAWSIRLGRVPGRGGQLPGTPIVVDGVMYVTTGAQHVLAIEAETGDVKWRYRPEAYEGPLGANRGVVVADGKVISARRDNVLIALDQETGHLVWETRLTLQRAAYTSAAPVYHDGVVFIGTAGGDGGGRGQIGAYDINTGNEEWTFDTVPGPDDRFGDTWEGDSYKYGGGAIWNHVALDPDLGLIFMGVGNAGPDTYGAARGGDNLFTASLLALDLETGEYQWHFQQVHHDIWDHDSASPPVLADITYQGQPRKIVMHPGKTGFLYIFDRMTGEPLIGIEERPVPQEPRMKTARTQPYPIGDRFVPLCPEPLAGYERSGCLFTPYWDEPTLIFPGSSGGNAWSPMTFSPQTNLVYIPANVMSTVFVSKHQVFDETTGRFKTVGGGAGFYRPAGAQRSGTMTAMDPTTNKIVWQQKMKYPMGTGGGLLSTAGGLIFSGQPDGNLVAYDINNGEELWKFQTGAGANAAPSTYEVDGEQYVAIMSGGNRLTLSQPGDYVWSFKLGGTVPEAPAPREPPLIHPDTGQGSPAPQR